MKMAGGPAKVEASDKLGAITEAAMGGALVTASYWAPLLDHVILGAHLIAVVTGAIIGTHGVIRIIKGRKQ